MKAAPHKVQPHLLSLQILCVLLMFISLNGQALAANCTAAYTHTNNGGSVNYNLTSGQSLKIASGTYTGTLNNFASGATICVETGSTFAPGNLNNAAGTLLNYGTSNLNTFSYNTGTVIDNYGTLSFLSGLNTNGATTFRNRANATMNMASSFQLGNSSSLTNDGLLLTQQDFNTQNGTTLTNNYRMEVAGNFNPSGKVDNYGRIYAKKFMNVNANSALSNYCTLVSYNGFNNNSSLMNNSGTILITTATGTPGGPWQNNQAFRNGSNARIAGGNFTNNSTFTGGGSMIFSGVTLNQGAFTGNSTSDKINFYDETQTGSQFFDSQNVTPTNTVRTAFTRPTELDAPTTCSGTYKSFALGDIYGTVYTDNNLNNTLDTTETRLPNMTVWLYDSTGVTLLQSKTTDASGVYSFTGVAAGIYQIKVDATDPDRPAGASIGTTNPLTPVTVTAGGTTANQNFGFDIAAAATKDFGDAPASYGSASHTIVSSLYLGQNPPSAETASKYSFNARADDNDDGAPRQPVVSYIPLFPVLKQTDTSYSASFTVNNTSGGAAKLYGWIDFDKSGTFQADEATFASVPNGSNNGSVTLNWASIPTDIQLGTTAIRLRLTTDPAVTVNTPTGDATNGEVEDFPLAIAMSIPANSPSISIVSGVTPAACEVVVFSDNFNDLPFYSYWGTNRAGSQAIRNWTRSGGGGDTYAHIESTATGGNNIYFGNGGVRQISPAIPGGFTFDANGKLLTVIDAISLRDDMDDITPGTTPVDGNQSDWGPQPVTFSRTFATVAGKTYRLYFNAYPEDVAGSFVSGIMRLDMPGGSIHFKAPGSTEGLQQYAVEFTATSTSSTIAFVNYGHVQADNNGWCDPNSYYNANPWCTVGGSTAAQHANELIIDDVVLAEAGCSNGAISGTVYTDTNANNTYDSGTESGIGSITVNLLNAASGASVATTSTAANGSYSFANVNAALTYRISVDTADTDLAGKTIGTTNPLTPVTVTAGATTANQNFGFDLPSTQAISGKVFEDVNYGGGAGRAFGTAGTAGISATRVELYSATGVFVSSTNTAADGSYTFSNLANGNYYVRVVNSTVKSSRVGSNGTERGIQTYRTNGVTANTNEVGGRKPAGVDSAANTTSQTLNTTTFLLSGGGQVQSVQPITVAGSAISGANFGFNFDTIVNANDSGQGSLRQFILNATLLGSDSTLAQTGRTAAKENAILELSTSDPKYNATHQYWSIAVQSELPLIGDDIILDASTQPARATAPSFNFANRPVIELNGSATAGTWANGLRLNGSTNGSTVKYFAINRFDNAGIKLMDSKNNLIEANYIGTDPTATANNLGNTGHGVNVISPVGLSVIRGNLIAHNYGDGVTVWNFNGVGVEEAALISSNSIYANLGLGIDLIDNDVTLNDANDADTGSNKLLNFPILSQITTASGNLTLQGCAPVGATVELFEADVSAGGKATPGANKFGKVKDYGEGQTYLASFVEGSAADTDSSNCTLSTDADGNNQTGMKAFSVTLPVPAGFVTGDAMTTTATLATSGTSEFSPVMSFTSTAATDYGDAPDSYHTQQSNNGASHTIVANFSLGATVDGETDGQPTAAADGDGADEDGVHFITPLLPGESALIAVGTTQTNVTTAYLNGWIDFNHDGDFADANEHIITDQTIASVYTTLALLANIPADAIPGDTYARFRLSSTSGTSYDGAAADGEVEDYQVTIATPSRVGDTVWLDTNQNGIQDAGEAGVPGVTVKLYRKSDNRLLGAKLTDSTGNYFFANELAAGTYYLEFTKPAGYQFTLQGAGTDPALNSDADPTTGRTGDITVVAGIPQTQWDAGLIANALVVTQCQAIPFSTTQVDHNFSVPKFDGALGTLTGVQVNAYSGIKQIWAIENRSTSASNFRITSTMPASFTLPNASSLALDYSYNSGIFSIPAFDGVTDYAGTSGKSLDAWRYEGSAVSNNYTPTADFVAASAGESITLPYSSGMGSMSLVGGGGNALFTIRTQASAGVCVNYTYTPPPQPPLGCSMLDNFDSTSVETISLTSSSQGPVTQTWNANVDGLIGGARTLTFGPAPRGTATNGYGLLDIANNAGTAANMKLCYNANGAGLNVNVSQIENILLNVAEDEHHNPDAATRANIPMTITLSDGFNNASLTQDMVSLAYQQLGTTDGWANLRFPLANFTNINSLNRNNVQSVCIEVAGKQGHDYAFEKVMLEDTNTCSSVTGKVFEDMNYGGGAGRALSSATNAQGVNGARLELYSNSGKLIESTNSYLDASNGAGTYTFAALTSGDYYVRAVSDTVNSSRSGANGTEVGVMTYRTDGTTPTTTEVGGRKPSGVDAGVNDRETILNTGTFTFNGGTLSNQPAQAVQPVTLSSSNPNAVNFGFNFSTIVNTNNAGQGSLRQFLVNNSLLSSAGLAQALPASLAGIYPVGSDISIFMIPPSQLTAGEALITLNSMLTLDRAYAAIDGRTQLANQGSGAVVLTGSGVGVGSDGLLLTENADHAAVRDISLRNFNGSGVIFAGADESVLERTAVSGNADYGVYLQADANSNQLLENTITGNGLSGIAQRTGAGNTFSRNSLTGNGGLAIDLDLDGVTANDAGDVDSGSNNLLNYPEIVAGSSIDDDEGSSISTNGSKVVTYDFDLDVPGNTYGYRIEFFSNTTPDASGHGEGEVYLGYKDIIHNGGGSQNFKGVFNANQPVAENANIAVTVTEKTSASALGSTSEFSGVRDGNVSVCTDLINGDGINAVINENSAIITMLEATDALGNPITYVISGGADGSLFMIIDPVLGAEFDCSTLVFKTEVIETRASAINKAGPLLPPPGDYEAPRDSGGDNIYDLIITAIDSQGHSVSKPVTVAVNNVNEKPVITSVSRTEVKEGQSGVVLAVSAYDPDTVDQNDAGLVYSLGYAGADGSRFTLDKTTGELRFVKTPDFEAPADSNHDNVYELELGVTDKAGYSSFSNLTVVVTDDKSEGVSLSARVLLQGAYESKTGLMQDDLRITGVLPVAQPYTLAPFAYAGTEQINLDLVTPTGADAIVDWVLLELRAANTSTTILARKAVLVQRDGDLVDAQTGQTQQVFAGLPDGNYQVSVRHRNHLGVMTAASVALTSANTLLDFTLAATPVQGQNARYVNGTLALLWAGDIQHDERLILDGVGNDRNQILSAVLLSKSNTGLNSNYRLSGYQPSDLNMNGETVFMGPGSDTNVLLGNVLLYPGNTKALSNFIVNGGMRE